MKKLKISLVSLGCPKNLVDAEVMLGHLPQERFEIIAEDALADIIVVNTCSFIQDAKEESIETILEVADHKQTGRCRMLIVSGCLPQRYQDELAEQLPEVDLFMGTSDAPRIVDLIERQLGLSETTTEISIPDYLYDHSTPRLNSSPFYTSYIKIADGCSNHCSYCIIPQLRGVLRSRSIDSVVAEARALADKGVREINLIAQDITAYGADREDGAAIEPLLRELVKIEKIDWIRLLYAYPDGIRDELINLIASEDKICNYLDIPLQHIDDQILKQMNRRLDAAGMHNLLVRLRQKIPDLTLRTSFIVGFPGETAAQFEQLLRFVKEGHFERVGVFSYSREEGTSAARFAGQIPARTKKSRLNRLMKAQAAVSLKLNRQRIGRIEKVLIEGLSDETDLLLKGRSAGQAPDVDGCCLITDGHAEVGQIVDLLITDATEYELIGEIEDESTC